MKPTDSKAPVPRAISGELRQRVLDLRRTHSLRQVAELTDLPLGTIKTICSRSGAFRDNLEHRALFTLPSIKESTNTEVSVPELPPQQVVTGDRDVDAMIWLRQVISTGQAALISKAMEAAKQIKTPAKELEDRYRNHLMRAHPGNVFAALSSFNFGDLNSLAKSVVERKARQREAFARLGPSMENVFEDTPAERFCAEALRGLKIKKGEFFHDEKQVDSRFVKHPQLMPFTLTDCLHELRYWHELYCLRASFENSGDSADYATSRDFFTFRMLARIRPRSTAEAVAVFRYMSTSDRMGMSESEAILLNLMGARIGTETH